MSKILYHPGEGKTLDILVNEADGAAVDLSDFTTFTEIRCLLRCRGTVLETYTATVPEVPEALPTDPEEGELTKPESPANKLQLTLGGAATALHPSGILEALVEVDWLDEAFTDSKRTAQYLMTLGYVGPNLNPPTV